MIFRGTPDAPIEIGSAQAARIETQGGYEGSYLVPDNFVLNALVNEMGLTFAFNRVGDYVEKRAADYAHPNPRLGQFRDIALTFKEVQPEGPNTSPELAISFTGLLYVSGRGKVAKVDSDLAVHRVKSTVPSKFYLNRYFTLRSSRRAYSEIYNDEALDAKNYKETREAVTLSGLPEVTLLNGTLEHLLTETKKAQDAAAVHDLEEFLEEN